MRWSYFSHPKMLFHPSLYFIATILLLTSRELWTDHFHYHLSSGKCKWKPQWDVSTHWPKWWPLRRPTIASVGEDVEQLYHSSWLLGTWNVTLQNNGAFSYRVTHASHGPTQQVPHRVYPRPDTVYVHTKMDAPMSAAFVIVDTNWKWQQCLSTGEKINCGIWMVTQHKNEETIITCSSMDESQNE